MCFFMYWEQLKNNFCKNSRAFFRRNLSDMKKVFWKQTRRFLSMYRRGKKNKCQEVSSNTFQHNISHIKTFLKCPKSHRKCPQNFQKFVKLFLEFLWIQEIFSFHVCNKTTNKCQEMFSLKFQEETWTNIFFFFTSTFYRHFSRIKGKENLDFFSKTEKLSDFFLKLTFFFS